MTDKATDRRSRGQSRTVRNTNAVRDAAIRVLADDGWGNLNTASVGRHSRLSTFAVRSRASTPAALAGLAWDEVGPPLLKRLEAVIDGLTLLREGGNARLITNAWATLATQSESQDAAAELLCVANNVAEVAVIVDKDLAPALTHWLSGDDDADRTRRAYAIGIGLGVLLTNRYPWAHGKGIDKALALRARVLAADAQPVALPLAPATHMTEAPLLVAEDPTLNRLLNATLALVAEHGYDAANIRDIAESVGATEGLVFGRYPSKLALVMDATDRQQSVGYQLNAGYMRQVETDHGLAVAEAVFMRESLQPHARTGRAMAIEQQRLTWHDSALLRESIDRLRTLRAELVLAPGWGQIETEADFYLNVAAPLGLLLLPRLAPEVAELPWDAVTTPLIHELTIQPHGPRSR